MTIHQSLFLSASAGTGPTNNANGFD